ncbi:acyltransferase family protein [Xanthomonadaceae bacterium JHOS43]|nr:acyltransferase family protein [Xanthomonadaceae bacterium JHOS43]
MSNIDTTTRIHALDRLRALAMLAGVAFHAALAYSPLAHPIWPAADRQNWAGIDVLIWLPHLVRMPLFFLVSGFFTAWLLARRGMTGLMRQRARRILIPLAVALPVVHLSLVAAIRWAAMSVETRSPLLELIRTWMTMPDAPQAPPGLGHLWFLYYLLLFTLLVWVGRTLELGRVLDRAMALGPRAVLLALPMVLAAGFALTSAPHPAPESLLPQFWAIVVFGPFFALGYALNGRLDWLRPLAAWLPGLAITCLVLYALFLWRIQVEPHPRATWPLVILEACLCAWGALACLIAALRWFDRPSRVLRYLAERAYWIYLLHLPILFPIQYALMDADFHWTGKLVAAITATMAITLLSYELLVRRTPLRRFVG